MIDPTEHFQRQWEDMDPATAEINRLRDENAALRDCLAEAENERAEQWRQRREEAGRHNVTKALLSLRNITANTRRDVLEALRDKVVWVEGRRLVAITRSSAITAPEDDEVKALCERHGYGAVMDAASRLWCKKHGTSAMFAGVCIGDKSLREALVIIDALIDEEKDNAHD